MTVAVLAVDKLSGAPAKSSESSFKVSLRNSGSEYCTEEYLKYWNFNSNIIDLASLKLNVKQEKLQHTFNGDSIVYCYSFDNKSTFVLSDWSSIGN
jgi:hypothetical protein